MQQRPTLRTAVHLGIGLTILIGVSACAAGDGGGDEHMTLDRQTGRLAPCPDSPNCVSTQAEPSDNEHHMTPLTYTGDLADAKLRILSIISEMPRATIVQNDEDYLHVEFRSRIFRFVDDVEFYFNDDAKTIHFRSAARMGKSDLGVNRKRMTEISQQFNAR